MQAAPACEQLGERADAELAEDRLAVVLHRVAADPEPQRDGFGRAAEEQQVGDFALARGERGAGRIGQRRAWQSNAAVIGASRAPSSLKVRGETGRVVRSR